MLADGLGDAVPAAQPGGQHLPRSPLYSQAHDGHSAARRFPHGTSITPPGCSSLRTALITSPVTASATVRQPRSRTGRAHALAAVAIAASCSPLSAASGRAWLSCCLIAVPPGGPGTRVSGTGALLAGQCA